MEQIYKNIIFINSDTYKIDERFSPVPSSKILPTWYKKIESYFPSDKIKNSDSIETIKACMPVFDAMSAGYIITTFCDIEVSIKDGVPNFKTSLPNAVEGHPRKQAYAHPLANEFDFPKFLNYWAIKTPKGYSCLFVPPMHHSNEYFMAMPGIVDTDKYNNCVNFPFVLKDPYKDILIPAGTPIVQVIPFKRDNWKSVFENNNNNNMEWYKKIRLSFFGGYKNGFWTRKEYR